MIDPWKGLLLLVGGLGCAYPRPAGYSTRALDGEIVSTGGALGDFKWKPDRCEPSSLNSLDFLNSKSPDIRVRLGYEHLSPEESQLDVPSFSILTLRVAHTADAKKAEIRVDSLDCVSLDGALHPPEGQGVVSLDCDVTEGGHIKGHLHVVRCGE